MKEVNRGYEIIAAEDYRAYENGRKYRVVLGRFRDHPMGEMFATWESVLNLKEDGSTSIDYYAGHYFNDERKARTDYHQRLYEANHQLLL